VVVIVVLNLNEEPLDWWEMLPRVMLARQEHAHNQNLQWF